MTETLAPPYRRNLAVFGANMVKGVQPTMYRKDNGTLVVQGQPVFRSGTFRDSMGMQHTWEGLHMDQMVAHYTMLRDRGLFADVPVRDGHPGFLVHGTPGTGAVVGWHTGLTAQELETHTGSKETFLLADYEFTDQDAAAKYENGTFRNRSSEVGEYTTNDEATFWPTYMGFAWVDIPAVEGLNAASFSAYSASDRSGRLIVPVEKEFSVSGTDSSGKPTGPGQGGTPPPVVPPAPSPIAFSINGQTAHDPVAVQNHINGLELFQREQLEKARVDFVNGLARDGKILATAVDSTVAFAKSLNPEQFQSYMKTMNDAPPSSVLANHGSSTQSPPATPGDQAVATKTATLRGVVSMHQASGMPNDQVRELSSYKELIALDPTAAI